PTFLLTFLSVFFVFIITSCYSVASEGKATATGNPNLSITSHHDGEVIRANGALISVSGEFTLPKKQQIDAVKFELFVNGAMVKRSDIPVFNNVMVLRGENQLKINAINHLGAVIASSKQIKIMVLRVSVVSGY
ncbi:MAG: hypothetical protein ACPH3C_07635, partial [Glaciecola sp.]